MRFKSSSRKTDAYVLDTIGAWDSTTDLPLEVGASIKQGRPIPKMLATSVGVSSVKGRREKQEDQFGIEQLRDDLLYVGIFDGHGGSSCSRFCAQQMPRHIEYWVKQKPEFDLLSILHCAFLEVNNAFARWCAFNRNVDQDSGTTATVCLIHRSIDLGISFL